MKTTSSSTDDSPAIRDAAVVGWRRRQLLAAGFELELAERLARECGVDLHALVDLVARGSSPELAAKILAPLADEHLAC